MARISSTVRSAGALPVLRNWLMALPPKMSPAPVVSTTWMPAGLATSAAALPVGKMAAPGAQRGIDQPDAVLGQQLLGARFGGKAPQKVDLLIADLDDVGLVQAPLDLLFGGGLRSATAVCAGWGSKLMSLPFSLA